MYRVHSTSLVIYLKVAKRLDLECSCYKKKEVKEKLAQYVLLHKKEAVSLRAALVFDLKHRDCNPNSAMYWPGNSYALSFHFEPPFPHLLEGFYSLET